MRTKFELAHAVNLFAGALPAKNTLTPLQVKALRKIASCRTAALGGHEEACQNCGSVRYSYNSCGDRHCPKCQAAKQAFWYGIYNHMVKRLLKLQFTTPDKPCIDAIIKQANPPETNIQRFERLTGFNPCLCPFCKKGTMVVVRLLPRIRSPPWNAPVQATMPIL